MSYGTRDDQESRNTELASTQPDTTKPVTPENNLRGFWVGTNSTPGRATPCTSTTVSGSIAGNEGQITSGASRIPNPQRYTMATETQSMMSFLATSASSLDVNNGTCDRASVYWDGESYKKVTVPYGFALLPSEDSEETVTTDSSYQEYSKTVGMFQFEMGKEADKSQNWSLEKGARSETMEEIMKRLGYK